MKPNRDLFAEYPEFEHVELDDRLRQLEWPSPAPAIKERGLEAIRQTLQEQRAIEHDPARVEPEKVVRVQRFELTRARAALRTTTWAAPRRQVRLAVSL